VSTALAGIITGIYLKKENIGKKKKALAMAVAGVGCLLVAQLWNLDFPINKNMWSSSFVMQTTGLSLLLMSLFYYIIDVLGYQKWAFFFKVIGMNSILIYISGKFINWRYTTNGFFQWLIDWVGVPYNLVMLMLCMIIVKWMFFTCFIRKKYFYGYE
jgi:predicted acyltransferase